MRTLSILCSIYLAVAFQTTFTGSDVSATCRFFFPALALIVIGLLSHQVATIFWSGFLGLILDGLSPENLGLNLAIATGLGFGLQRFVASRKSLGLIHVMLAVSAIVVVWRTVGPLVGSLLVNRTIDVTSVMAVALVESLPTACLAGLAVLVSGFSFGERHRESAI